MSVRQSLLFFSLAALAVAGTASAQDREQTFQERDRNNDGVLTQGEYGGHPGNFRALDVNGDGVLNHDEFVRRHGRVDDRTSGFADPFTMMDRNRDGFLTIQEYTGADVLFRRMDRNDDNRLSRAEFNNEEETREDLALRRRFRTLDRNDDARLSRGEARMNSTEFRTADYNRNGYLSMLEFVTWTNRTATGLDDFDTLDRNNDGAVSWGEWRSQQRDRASFDRLDRNDDRMVTRAEYRNQAVGYTGNDVLGQFRALDRNDDGLLTRWESGLGPDDFKRADDDNDGVLTLKEYRQVSEVGDQFTMLDRNNDGRISRWEWNGDRDDFDRMDRNDDGVLVRSEYDRRTSGGGFLGSILGRVEDVRFNEMDVNNDGILRPNEWRGSMVEFDRLDTNNDGVLNVYEFTR